MTQTKEPAQRAGGIESRSIDYVPLTERHGKLWHLGPLWFMSNAQIATLAVGLISITEGATLPWSIIAIVVGTLLGTLFMAFHSAQGPQLGLPQMIQSRPQFGYLGALLVWLFAYVQYAGFNVFNTVLASESMSKSTGTSWIKPWHVIITLIGVAIAIIGYDLIHRAEQILTYAMLIVFGIVTVLLFTLHYPAGTFDLGHFQAAPFFGQFGVVAGYQISWAIYVSDYSRYLPPDVTVRKTFYWTYGGSAVGGAWMMVIGATLAAWKGKAFSGNAIAELKEVGNHFFNGFGDVVLVLAALGLVSVIALNMYGGSLTLISAVDSFSKVKPTLGIRIATIAFTAVLSLLGALVATSNFLSDFNNFLLLVLYLFIPWTAVNLVDYYVVRRGHYAIAEIFKPNGMYGRWGWPGIVSYLVGFIAMTPFFVVGSLYTGFVAKSIHDVDISFFIGLPVAGLLYWFLARNIDVEAETRVAREEQEELERAAVQGTL
ncbi:purine-cytosine permease family protein [Allobranchiibius huperziae]|uniref:NCS1 nucleoside transporter family n=1 Tax=Allobranchiibius huperziae TaxID=1874116 RepID=A0A853D847_9MICO|nr:cytosine permease [Allobranchiibius huperziae]NYJ73342.1 NCS1 nucleoside transporter family [Allobranchiibius huperziae]